MTGDRLFSFGVIDDDDRTERERKPALPVRCLDDEILPKVEPLPGPVHRRRDPLMAARYLQVRLLRRCADGGWCFVDDAEARVVRGQMSAGSCIFEWMTDAERKQLGLPTGRRAIVQRSAKVEPKKGPQ